MSYELKGTVKVVLDMMTFDSGFTKREFVVTTDEQYPQDIKFECVKDKTALLDSLNEGDQVNVHFDIRGREHNERFYVNLNAWRIEADSAGGASSDGGVSAPPPPPPGGEDLGDLPF